MSTTVVQQRTTRLSGKSIGMALTGLAVAAAIGFGIANLDDAQQQTAVFSPEAGRAYTAVFSPEAGRAYTAAEPPALAAPGVGVTVVPEIVSGGTAAPTLRPIESVRTDRHWFGRKPQSEPNGINNTEPFGDPNYGRLDTYLGGEPASGPR